MWTGHNPARQRAALYENFCKVPVPSDHETLLSSISYAALQHGFHSTFYSFRASTAHIVSPYLLKSNDAAVTRPRLSDCRSWWEPEQRRPLR